MKTEVERILQPLIGLPLWDFGRNSFIEWFVFGNERRAVPARDGGTKTVSEYSLHVQCSWRFRGPEGILVGSHYRWRKEENPVLQKLRYSRGFAPEPRFEERVAKFYAARGDQPLLVLAVQADEVGGFQLVLSDGYFLEVFPDGSLDTEDWRLFSPYTDKDHFVSNGYGIFIE